MGLFRRDPVVGQVELFVYDTKEADIHTTASDPVLLTIFAHYVVKMAYNLDRDRQSELWELFAIIMEGTRKGLSEGQSWLDTPRFPFRQAARAGRQEFHCRAELRRKGNGLYIQTPFDNPRMPDQEIQVNATVSIGYFYNFLASRGLATYRMLLLLAHEMLANVWAFQRNTRGLSPRDLAEIPVATIAFAFATVDAPEHDLESQAVCLSFGMTGMDVPRELATAMSNLHGRPR